MIFWNMVASFLLHTKKGVFVSFMFIHLGLAVARLAVVVFLLFPFVYDHFSVKMNKISSPIKSAGGGGFVRVEKEVSKDLSIFCQDILLFYWLYCLSSWSYIHIGCAHKL
jgi:hypothetical protein